MHSSRLSRLDPRHLQYGDRVTIVSRDDKHARATIIALFEDEGGGTIAIAALDDVDLKDVNAKYTVGVLRIIPGRFFDGLLGAVILHDEDETDWMEQYQAFVAASHALRVTTNDRPSRLPRTTHVIIRVDGRIIVAQIVARIAFGELGEYQCELYFGSYKDSGESVLIFYKKEDKLLLPMDQEEMDQVHEIYLREIGPIEGMRDPEDEEVEQAVSDIDYC